MRVQRILVPLDHSAGSDHVVQYACMIARAMNAHLTFLHVYEPPNEMIGIVPGATIDGEAAAERRAGEALLDDALSISRASGIPTADRVLERATPPHQAILAYASQSLFDMIVMGTHGRSGVSRLVMGSVAEEVLRHAPCPVLLVHVKSGHSVGSKS